MDNLSIYHGPNAGYVLELYDRFRQDPESVDPDTRALFETSPPPADLLSPSDAPPAAPARPSPGLEISKIVGAARLARMIREVGHLGASIDPLGSPPPGDSGLLLNTHGLSVRDLSSLPASVVGGPLADHARNAMEAISLLRVAYSSTIGYEDDHIQIAEERKWLRDSIESRRFFSDFSDQDKRDLLDRLTSVEVFERYLHQTFIGQKRFSIEGCDMLIPMLDLIINQAADAGVQEVLIGMAHRGRLNVLAHVLGKPYSAILAAFQTSKSESAAESDKGSFGWTGDVKYHQGAGFMIHGSRRDMPATLASNPSHLEYVNPIVLGRTRAAQERRDKAGAPVQDQKAAGSILIHGDAAFPGQGVVAETLNLGQLPGYSVGGTIHIIVNNQIGFTTAPREGRSTLYASDLAKGYEIPIVHVNADDPMACIAAARMALDYSVTFHKDFLIDLVGYRRWGHNEGDEPTFTQPRMYQVISSHPTVREIWARSLEREGLVTHEETESMVKVVYDKLNEARNKPIPPDTQKMPTTTAHPPGLLRQVETAVPEEKLRAMNDALFTPPENFNVNTKLQRVMDRRLGGLDEEKAIDWGHAEMLAFAAILEEGTPIRMTGQDIERGTFSHRHAVLNDPRTGGDYIPLQNLPQAQASFAIYNSPLSEMAVLGFEYGYTRHAPGTLVLWEAQFGDFANSSQVIIDQFIVAGFAKWRQTPTLVMLLPHGYEGQGPEHSSARLERFLQLCANDNIRVVNPTTSAQYFHLLRRQAALLDLAPRPLVVMSPKSLLRNPHAGSSLRDLTEGSFQPVLYDDHSQDRPREVTRLLLCSGKVYVDLISREEYPETQGLAVVRLEELYPFPLREVEEALDAYPNLQEVIWLQEEPQNMGAWSFVQSRLSVLLNGRWDLQYYGRPESAAPSEGSLSQHTRMQNRILSAALSNIPPVEAPPLKREEVSHAR